MKKIQTYTEYIKESVDNYFLQTYSETKEWLDKKSIENYTINDDLTVDVDDNVNIAYKNLTEIPVKFNKVNNNFYCSSNKLTSLKGCPNIINGHFDCFDNPYLVDINDLDSKILIKSIKYIKVSQEVYDKYFEFWISKDINIFEVLKDKVSDNIRNKYDYLFNANNFDLI